MDGPTMQCNTKTYQTFQLSATVSSLCPQTKSSQVNRSVNDQLLDAWRTIIQMSPQLISISHRILIDLLM